MFLIIITLIYLVTFEPYTLGDPDNFILANPIITPIHIKPEWYFLFAYAILRSIPNKLGGVMALLISILIFYIVPFINKFKIKGNQFLITNKILFWLFLNIFILLTWAGAKPVEEPFIFISQILSIIYFLVILINPWTKILKINKNNYHK